LALTAGAEPDAKTTRAMSRIAAMSQEFATKSQDRQVERPRLSPGLFLQPFIVSQLVGSVVVEILDGTGLVGSEFAVLSSLGVVDDSTPTELAGLLGMSPTTLSAILKRLEERGLVRRARDPEDRRRHVLRLTAKGRRELAKAYERFPEWLGRVRTALGADPDEVLAPMRRLEAALREALSSGS
jgi:DNA-binding MarR family transcriptional regulator